MPEARRQLRKLLRYARATGKQIVSLIEQDLRPRAILTRGSAPPFGVSRDLG